MIELRDWIRSSTFDPKPWLLLGKGPTFSRRGEFPLGDYNLIGLNNVVTEQKVDVAHIIDIDVVEKCADALRDNCRFLVIARRPHVRFRPGERRLEDYFGELAILRELDEQGRLVWYNAATSPAVDGSPEIGIRFFSSEAAMNILGEMGVKKVRTLGIDGGTQYGTEFKDLPELQNSLPSFDAQFRELEDIVATIRFLCSDDAAAVNGAKIPLDGRSPDGHPRRGRSAPPVTGSPQAPLGPLSGRTRALRPVRSRSRRSRCLRRPLRTRRLRAPPARRGRSSSRQVSS